MGDEEGKQKIFLKMTLPLSKKETKYVDEKLPNPNKELRKKTNSFKKKAL